MINKILQIIDKWGCHHKWKLEVETKVLLNDYGYYYRRIYICEKCGKFKKIKL